MTSNNRRGLPPRGIFLSYRRSDSAEILGRIYDRLLMDFHREQVFRDLDSIAPGSRFADVISDAVARTAVGLVLIGPKWLSCATDDGVPRLRRKSDFVRREVEGLLSGNALVIPVLVHGAQLPRASELPASIRALVELQVLTIRVDPDFQRDVSKLIGAIKEVVVGCAAGLDRVSPGSCRELRALVRYRAKMILREMDDAGVEFARQIAALPKGSESARKNCEQVAAECVVLRGYFRVLHQRHMQMLRKGAYLLAHEVARDIHAILADYTSLVAQFGAGAARVGRRLMYSKIRSVATESQASHLQLIRSAKHYPGHISSSLLEALPAEVQPYFFVASGANNEAKARSLLG